MDKQISLVIAEDHQFYIDTLVHFFKGTNMVCIGHANNGRELLALLQEDVRPDVVLLDINMPILDGSDTLEILTQRYPELKIIIISQYEDNTTITNYFERGVSGYVTKGEHATVLIKAINEVVKHGKYTANVSSVDKAETPRTFLFTQREIDVIRGILDNKTTKQMSDELCVSIKTIEIDRNQIYTKAGVSTVAELIKLTNTTGWYYMKM